MEHWLPYPKYPRYFISDLGNVEGPNGPNKLQDSLGYVTFTVLTKEHKYQRIKAHIAVLETFIGPRPLGYITNHKNGIKDDNRVENLEWVTHSENVIHALTTRLRKLDKNRKNLLTRDEILEIRQLHEMYGFNLSEAAKEYKKSRASIYFVITKKTWATIISLLICFFSYAQTICIPIKVADTIEFQIQQKYHLDTLAAIRKEHIDSLNSVIVFRDSLNSNLKQRIGIARDIGRDSVRLQKVFTKEERRKRLRNGWQRNGLIIVVGVLVWLIVKP